MADEAISKPSGARAWLMRAVKAIIFLVVAYFIWRAIANANRRFDEEQFSLADVNLWWLAAAGGLYLMAELPMAWFWHAAMNGLGQRPRLWESLRAFYMGSLGKYVPGKAMVVVLRTGLVRSKRVDTTVAALCVFIETLTMMAVGGFVAAIYLLVRELHSGGVSLLVLLAVGLLAATGLPTLPPIFRRFVYLLRVSKANAEIDTILRRLNIPLVLKGWGANLISWPLMGLSLWATLRAIPSAEAALAGPVEELPLLTAAVALAVVAGFVSLLPVGLGVREVVLIPLLAPKFGPVVALVSVILLRLAWLLSEVGFSGILYVMGKVAGNSSHPATSATPADTK